jgi:hypothetical protein
MKTHEIKIRCDYAEMILSGKKTFEIRVNDRDYREGDEVIMTQVDQRAEPIHEAPKIHATIGTVLEDWGLKRGYVVFSLLDVHEIKLGDKVRHCRRKKSISS